MGLFSCWLAPTTNNEVEDKVEHLEVSNSVAPKQQEEQPVLRAVSADDTLPVSADSNLSRAWSKLNQLETTAVQQTLLKVGSVELS